MQSFFFIKKTFKSILRLDYCILFLSSYGSDSRKGYTERLVDRSIEWDRVGSCSTWEGINRVCLDVDWGWKKVF